MSNRKMIIKSNFNIFIGNIYGVQYDPEIRKTKEWIEKKLNIFMNYTLKSFKMQTNQNFLAVIRFEDDTEEKIFEALSHYEELPANVQFIRSSKFRKKILEYAGDCDELYVTRVDTDDMYHKSYIQKLFDYTPKKEGTKVLLNQDGYMYDSIRKEILKVKYKSPPFHTNIYKKHEIQTDRMLSEVPKGHLFLVKFPYEVLEGNNYIWHIHDSNISVATGRYHSADGISVNPKEIITNHNEIKKLLEEYIGH